MKRWSENEIVCQQSSANAGWHIRCEFDGDSAGLCWGALLSSQLTCRVYCDIRYRYRAGLRACDVASQSDVDVRRAGMG